MVDNKGVMRVACLCNMNNMMFTLSRFLRDIGYEVHLFELKDEPFSLESDSYIKDFESYSTELTFNRDDFFDADDSAFEALKGYDFYIGVDIAPAILAKLGITLDLFVPHGSDIYAYPFAAEGTPSANKIWWTKSKKYIAQMQQLGIEKCPTIIFPDEYDIHFPYKDKLKFSGVYFNHAIPMVYHPQYQDNIDESLLSELIHFSFFKDIRDQSDFIVFLSLSSKRNICRGEIKSTRKRN